MGIVSGTGGLAPGALAMALAVAGAVWGLAADRIAARWPAHEDGSVRRIDWRTVVVVVLGAVALAAVPGRFEGGAERLLFGTYFAALILLLATDLDQRLLPDVVTFPLMALGLLAIASGADSLITRYPVWWPFAGAIVVPLVLFALSIPFGSGALGLGDVKFLVGLGLLTGLTRTAIAVFIGGLASGLVVAVLLAARRVTLKSYIPFGPFLIIGAFWAVLLPAASS